MNRSLDRVRAVRERAAGRLPLARPAQDDACAPRLGFLAYDRRVLPPLGGLLARVRPEPRASLHVDLAVPVCSAAIAVWFLHVRADTRRGLLSAGLASP